MDIAAWIWLHRLELPAVKAKRLLDRFGSPEAVQAASTADLKSGAADITGAPLERLLAARHDTDVSWEIGRLEEMGAVAIPITSAAYPASLRAIYDPPILIFVLGELRPDDRFAVGIVGSRRATHYGKSVAGRLAKDLADRGVAVVSGLAYGIDTEAHKGALKAGRTLAVLGSGLDVIYPAPNRDLAVEIARNGAIISEAPLGAQPDAWRFPARNRIISGLSLGVILVETPAASGALHTATFALEQGKSVMAVPGDVTNGKNTGCHRLLREGACLVESYEDVMLELGVPIHALPDAPTETLPLPVDLTDDEARLMEVLTLQPLQMEEIITQCALAAPAASAALMMLEIKGFAKRLTGNSYVRCL